MQLSRSSIILGFAALAASCASLAPDTPPRLTDPTQPRTAQSFHHDAVTMTYWHMLSIKCPFEKRVADDLGFAAMVIFNADDAPRIDAAEQARIDADAQALESRALARDHDGVCRSALQDMRADIELQFKVIDEKEKHRQPGLVTP